MHALLMWHMYVCDICKCMQMGWWWKANRGNHQQAIAITSPSFVLIALNFYLHLCYSKWTITRLLAHDAEFLKSKILSFSSYKCESRYSSSLLHVTFYLLIYLSLFFSSCTSYTHFFASLVQFFQIIQIKQNLSLLLSPPNVCSNREVLSVL